MVVAGPEGLRKNQYRKFNIRSTELAPGDDYGMLREVLQRRFKRLLEESPREPISVLPSPLAGEGGERSEPGEGSVLDVEYRPLTRPRSASPPPKASAARWPSLGKRARMPKAFAVRPLPQGEREREQVENNEDEINSPWPDLVLIDGGQGQLRSAQETLVQLGVTDVPLVAIAKGQDRDAGRETFFMAGRAPFKLPPRDPLLYFVERLRDEAHRFAIGSHRARRKKDIREAGLQEIPGIGPTRKRALLRHFGTVKAIERASLPDLAQVPGINAETARKIYEYFHEQAAG